MANELEPFKKWDTQDPDKMFVHRLFIENAMIILKNLKSDLDKDLIAAMSEKGIKSFQVGEGELAQKVFIKQKTTARFASEKIIEMMGSEDLGVSEQAIACLPKNPAFKKGQVDELMRLTKEELFWEDVSEAIEVRAISLEQLKIINLKKQNQEANNG